MGLVINSNIQSLNAQRNLSISSGELNQAQERLSSGQRINSAADDAAGLAISEGFTSQIRGLNQAVRNANDGISLIQTAEGALDESTNILQRIRELSIQSANGTFDEGNRATIDAEVQQLVAEVDRIAETTAFNGLNILDGSVGNLSLQVGAQANQTIELDIQAVDSATLGLGSTSSDVLGAEIAANIDTLSLDADDIQINGQSIGAFQGTAVANGSEDTLEDLVNQISENVNGVTAGIFTEAAATSVGDGILEGAEVFTVATTEANGTSTSFSIQNTQSLQELADRINEEGGGRVSATINDDGQLSISSQSARNITITDAGGAGGDDIAVAPAQAQITLTSDNGDPIEITRGGTGSLADLNILGFRESGEQGVIEGAGITSDEAAVGLNVGDLTINGVQIDNEDTDSLGGRINAINDVSDQTGVTANAFAQVTLDFANINITSAFTNAANLDVNGIEVDFAAGLTTLQQVADEFNNQTDQTGVTAEVSGTRLILESDQGAINLQNVSGTANGGFTSGANLNITTFTGSGTAATATFATDTGLTVDAGIQLTATNGNPISVELGGDTAAARALVAERTGLLETNSTEGGRFGASLNSIDVTTAANAQRAIGVVDNALDTINSVRGDLGAVNNRLDFTINNLTNVSQNASASRSRIEDADFAAESAALSRAQVLQQAGTAILAQANAAPQQVLSLLQ